VLGADCTLGIGSFVHYGVTMGEGAELTADAFLMKGEEVPPHERWEGNPAAEVRADRALPVGSDSTHAPDTVAAATPIPEQRSRGRNRAGTHQPTAVSAPALVDGVRS
jgi:carbonic anhydrase/acetyltransferase-like protein (isoleucine patch superfamily)